MIVDEHRVAVGEGRLVGGHAHSETIDWVLRKEGKVGGQRRWTDAQRKSK